MATGTVFAGAGVGSAVIALTLEKLITATTLETALKVLGVSAWAICIPASYFLRAPAGRGRGVSSIQWYVLMAWTGATTSYYTHEMHGLLTYS